MEMFTANVSKTLFHAFWDMHVIQKLGRCNNAGFSLLLFLHESSCEGVQRHATVEQFIQATCSYTRAV